MKCSKCNQEIPDGSKFCPHCGALQEGTAASDVQQNQSDPKTAGSSSVNPQNQTPDVQTKKNVNKASIAIIAAITIFAILIVSFFSRKPTVDLNQYVLIGVTGYSSMGTTSCSFNREKFFADYGDKLKMHKRALKKALDVLASDTLYVPDYGMTATEYFSNIQKLGSVSPASKVSNGDELTFSWWLSDEDFKALGDIYGCTFKASDVTITADGLYEIPTFDPFDGVSISYSGASPDGEVAEISKGKDEICSNLSYRATPSSGLANGDTITVDVFPSALTGDETQYYLDTYNKLPEETSMEFTVEGLPEYMTSASQISDDLLKQMQAKAEEVRKDKLYFSMNDPFGRNCELEKCQYIGNFFLTKKEGSNGIAHNIIYMVYKLRSHLYDEDRDYSFDKQVDAYWYCSFKDAAIASDGAGSVDLDSGQSCQNGFDVQHIGNDICTPTWTMGGYETLEDLKASISADAADAYVIEEDNTKDVDYGEAKENIVELDPSY